MVDWFKGQNVWHLRNKDQFSEIQGQFRGEQVQERVGSQWATHFALNRQRPIRQFLHGTLEQITLNVTFYARHSVEAVDDWIGKLREWSRRDNLKGRPPILEFWIGDGHLTMDCTLEPLGFDYFPLREAGRMRGATIPITLTRYDPYDVDEQSLFDTRYHRVRDRGEYYEYICQREYDSPDIGVIIRHRNPDKVSLSVGDKIALPAPSGIRTERIRPISPVFETINDARVTPAQELMSRVIQRISVSQSVFFTQSLADLA